jgi:hypothetical protein
LAKHPGNSDIHGHFGVVSDAEVTIVLFASGHRLPETVAACRTPLGLPERTGRALMVTVELS